VAMAAWLGAMRRAMAKRRKSRTKKIGELRPPVEKISNKDTETSTRVAKKKVLLALRKKNLETK